MTKSHNLSAWWRCRLFALRLLESIVNNVDSRVQKVNSEYTKAIVFGIRKTIHLLKYCLGRLIAIPMAFLRTFFCIIGKVRNKIVRKFEKEFFELWKEYGNQFVDFDSISSQTNLATEEFDRNSDIRNVVTNDILFWSLQRFFQSSKFFLLTSVKHAMNILRRKDPSADVEKRVWIWLVCVAQQTQKSLLHSEKQFFRIIMQCLNSKDTPLRFATLRALELISHRSVVKSNILSICERVKGIAMKDPSQPIRTQAFLVLDTLLGHETLRSQILAKDANIFFESFADCIERDANALLALKSFFPVFNDSDDILFRILLSLCKSTLTWIRNFFGAEQKERMWTSDFQQYPNAINEIFLKIENESQCNKNKKWTHFLQRIEPLMFEFFSLVIPLLHSAANFASDISEFQSIWDEMSKILKWVTLCVPKLRMEFWEIFDSVLTIANTRTTFATQETSVAIANYITRGSNILSHKESQLQKIIDIVERFSEDSDYEYLEVSCYLFERLLLCIPDILKNERVQRLLESFIKKIDNFATDIIQIVTFRVVFTAMHIDPILTLQKLSVLKPEWWSLYRRTFPRHEKFIPWFGHTERTTFFGLSALFRVPLSVIPESLLQVTNSLQKVLLIVLNLGREIRKLQDNVFMAPIEKVSTPEALKTIFATRNVDIIQKKTESEQVNVDNTTNEETMPNDAPKIMVDIEVDEMDQLDDLLNENYEDNEPVNEFDSDDDEFDYDNDEGSYDHENREDIEGSFAYDQYENENMHRNLLNPLKEIDVSRHLFDCLHAQEDQYKMLLSLLSKEDLTVLNDFLSRVQIGPKSLVHLCIETIGKDLERYCNTQQFHQLPTEVVESIYRWLITPRPVSRD